MRRVFVYVNPLSIASVVEGPSVVSPRFILVESLRFADSHLRAREGAKDTCSVTIQIRDLPRSYGGCVPERDNP